jgi:DNA-binding NtrC family response regulator
MTAVDADRTARVLIVEDDESMAELVGEELADEGYEVEVVYSGDEALAAIESRPPNVVVLDINMPGKDGIETLNDIVSERGSLPVILHTAYSAYKDNYMTWSAVEYVVKSAAGGFKELKEAVAKAVSSAE